MLEALTVILHLLHSPTYSYVDLSRGLDRDYEEQIFPKILERFVDLGRPARDVSSGFRGSS